MNEGEKNGFLALSAPPGIGEGEAAALVRRELHRRGLPLWPETEIELFEGTGSSLLIARRAEGEKMYVSLAALRWLLER